MGGINQVLQFVFLFFIGGGTHAAPFCRAPSFWDNFWSPTKLFHLTDFPYYFLLLQKKRISRKWQMYLPPHFDLPTVSVGTNSNHHHLKRFRPYCIVLNKLFLHTLSLFVKYTNCSFKEKRKVSWFRHLFIKNENFVLFLQKKKVLTKVHHQKQFGLSLD